MSTKLNAEELAAKRWQFQHEEPTHVGLIKVYREIAEITIREVAQPIADERDEYRKALDAILANWDSHLHQPEQLKSGDIGDGKTFEYWSPSGAMIDTEPIAKARAILSKYKRP